MIRRWSYINTINTTNVSTSVGMPRVRQDASVKYNMYLKVKFSKVSLVTRRAWVKRRHLNNFAIYRNVLADWSKEYIFYRKYAKFTFMLNLFRNTFWAQNLLISKNSLPSNYAYLESVYSMSLSRSFMSYFSFKGSLRFKYLLTFKNTSWLYVTAPQTSNLLSAQSKTTFWPLYRETNSHLLPIAIKDRKLGLYNQLLQLASDLALSKAIEIYKVNILLTLMLTQ